MTFPEYSQVVEYLLPLGLALPILLVIVTVVVVRSIRNRERKAAIWLVILTLPFLVVGSLMYTPLWNASEFHGLSLDNVVSLEIQEMEDKYSPKREPITIDDPKLTQAFLDQLDSGDAYSQGSERYLNGYRITLIQKGKQIEPLYISLYKDSTIEKDLCVLIAQTSEKPGTLSNDAGHFRSKKAYDWVEAHFKPLLDQHNAAQRK